MKTKQKYETLLSAETYREVCLFRNHTREGFIFNGVFMKTLAFIFLLTILVGCGGINEPLPQPPKEFINYKPFSLSIGEMKVFAHIDNVDLSVTYHGININGWIGISWESNSGMIFDPKVFEGKDIYLNYATLQNTLAQIRFLKIEKDKGTFQCIEIFRNK